MLRHTSLSLNHLTFRLPEGRTVLNDLTVGLGPGHYGLIGDNGTGKSTLLKLITGELQPTAGSVTVSGEFGHLPQDLAAEPERTVADLLCIAETLRALEAIHAGSVRIEDFDAVGDDWDIAERAQAALGRVGLDHLSLDRTADTLSGGELVLLSLTALVLRRPAILLLDEPTNNLDSLARARLYDVVADFTGTLLLVSHDRELQERMDHIGELRDGGLRWFGGGFSLYEEAIAAESEAAAQAVATARNNLRQQKRDLIDQQSKQARRDKQGRANAQNEAPILAGAKKRRAQETTGRLREMHRQRAEQAQKSLDEAEERVREDAEIRIDLPATAVPAQRDVLRAVGVRSSYSQATLDLSLRGSERVALTGPNGAGKSSLLRCLLGEETPEAGTAEVMVPFRHLPQSMQMLDPQLSVIQNVRRFAPDAERTRIRHQLALFLLRRDAVHQPAGTLSGGERWRATLACLLLAEPAPQLLILDEPTNNLDLTSLRHLTEALRWHRGALLIVSHDELFLDELELSRRRSLV